MQANGASAGRKMLLKLVESGNAMRAGKHTICPESRIRERAGGKRSFRFAAWGGAGELSEAASGVQIDQKGDKPRGEPAYL